MIYIYIYIVDLKNPDAIMDVFNALAALFEAGGSDTAQQQQGRRMCGEGSRYQYSIPIDACDVHVQCMRWAMELGVVCKLADTLDPSSALMGAPRSNAPPLDILLDSNETDGSYMMNSSPSQGGVRLDPGYMSEAYKSLLTTASARNGRGVESIFAEGSAGRGSDDFQFSESQYAPTSSAAVAVGGIGGNHVNEVPAMYNFGLNGSVSSSTAQNFNFSDVNWSSDADDVDFMQVEEEEEEVVRSPSSSSSSTAIPMLSLTSLSTAATDTETMQRPRSFDLAMGSARSLANLSPPNSAVGSGPAEAFGGGGGGLNQSSSATSLGLSRKATDVLEGKLRDIVLCNIYLYLYGNFV